MYLKGIKLVTFDATNTLLKFRTPPWEYYALIAEKYGYKGKGNNLKGQLLNNYKIMNEKYPNFGKCSISWKKWWTEVVKRTFYNQIPDTNLDVVAQILIEEFKTIKCWSKAQGCDNLINLLKQSGITIGVISNFDPRLHDILENVNLVDSLKFVITSYEVGFSKPDKRIFEYAQLKCNLNLLPSECLHIGDDLQKDYEGARNAGWHSVLISDNIQEYEKSVLVFKSLEKLCETLSSKRLNLQ